jgi:predicted dehydrogenase
MPPPDDDYKLEAAAPERTLRTLSAPALDYRPRLPETYRPRIGLIGCGGITASHLNAYRADGLDVAALCDLNPAAAEARREAYYPNATVYADYRDLLARDDIGVVDITLHPGPRAAVIEAAILAGKHVLSQKPFVLDLDEGARLAALADARGVKLAVNQNGRWAPYVRYLYQAVHQGLLGDIQSVDISIHWDHAWVKNTPFESIHHLILFDFGVHWFDMCRIFFENRQPLQVSATTASAPAQPVRPPLLAQAAITFDHGLASLTIDGFCRHGPEESIILTGSHATIRSRGPVCDNQDITLFTPDGACHPRLDGQWFDDGFRGAMGELLCSIEEDRQPFHSARNNLRTLEITFAAIHAANTGQSQIPGAVRAINPSFP